MSKHSRNGLPDPTLTPSERARRSLSPEDRDMIATLPEPSVPREGEPGARVPSFTVGAVLAHSNRLRESDSGSLARALIAIQEENDFLRRELQNLIREIGKLRKVARR